MSSFEESKSTGVVSLVAVGALVVAWIRKRIRSNFVYRSSLIDGIHYPPFQTEEKHAKICDTLRKSVLDPKRDIFIATFPKCGTTWLQQICLELTRHETNANGEAEGRGAPMDYHESPWPEAMLFRPAGAPGPAYKGRTLEELSRCFRWGGTKNGKEALRFLKTHARIEHLPGLYRSTDRPLRTRAIVVTRNPKDACVSMFHHARRIPVFEYDGSFDDWVARYARGHVESGSYWEWHTGWWLEKQKRPNTILWIHFEDLKRSPAEEIAKIARFLGVADDMDEGSLQALVQRTIKATTFKKMKTQYKSGHFRKGKSGGWRACFSAAQSEWYDKLHRTGFSGVPELRDSYQF